MKTILIMLILGMSKLCFAIQSIDLAGELPPSTTLITETTSGNNLRIRSVGDINGDGQIDLLADSEGAILYFFLQNISPIDSLLTVQDANFVLTKQNSASSFLHYRLKDLNNDNIDDIIFYGQSTSKIFIIFGGSNLELLSGQIDIESIADVVILKDDSEDSSIGFGDSIDTGDVNGDSINDLLVSTFGNTGRAYLFYGTSTWADTIDLNFETADVTLFSSNKYSKNVFVEDLNDDGFSDIIFGEYTLNNLNGSNDSGLISVFYGSSSLAPVLNFSDKDKLISGLDNEMGFGINIKSGYLTSTFSKDIILGEGDYFLDAPNVYSYDFQSLVGDTVDLNQLTSSASFDAEYGLGSFFQELIFMENVNNDQFDDLVIPDLTANNSKGKTYIYFGGNLLNGQVSLSNQTADFVVLGAKENDGAIVKRILDLNDDGFLDFVISIPGYDTATQSGVGAVMIVWGDSLGFDNDPIPSAGNDQIGEIDSLVLLDGSETYDIDGDSLSFFWTQVSGTTVNLQNQNQEIASFVVPNTAPNGEELVFSLEVTSNSFVVYDTTKVTVLDPTISAEENSNLPKGFSLSQNFPNPFNPNTVISYQLPVNSKSKLVIFNVLGEEVKDFELSESKGSVVWNGTDSFGNSVGSGIYFYRLEVGNFRETKKMLLLR